MKAIRVHAFGGPDVLQLEEVPAGAVGRGQVLVRLHAIGVNPVDTYIRAGTYARKPSLPYTPGTDGAGVVQQVGPGVGLTEGQRVYVAATLDESFPGAYQETVVCDPRFVYPLADRASFAQGAAIGVPYATAYRALMTKALGRPGQRVLVHGASGGVGLAALQIARAFGFEVIGTAGSAKGRALVAEHGAHLALDHTSPTYTQEILAYTAGRGVDIVLEMLANVNLNTDLTLLAPSGRVVVIGSRGDVQLTPRLTMAKDATITGMALWNTPLDDMRAIHAALSAGLGAGWLTPVIARDFPLAQAALAHEAVLAPGAHGKIVLTA